MGVKIMVEGKRHQLNTGNYLIISNHLSYVDGIVLGSLFPIIFVSKREIRSWPWVGQWNALCGTIFVDRGKRGTIRSAVEQIACKLGQEINVLLFPEGTSTNGEHVLPFQSAFFAAPLMSQTAVLPLTLAYRRIDKEPISEANRDRLYWYGGMPFPSHFWDLLALRTIEVAVTLHPVIETSGLQNNSQNRKKLSEDCYELITSASHRGDRPDRRTA